MSRQDQIVSEGGPRGRAIVATQAMLADPNGPPVPIIETASLRPAHLPDPR